MDNERRDNVMPVELAIQRELEYRKKVEMLRLQPYSQDSWKEFLPLQVPSSSSGPNLEPWPSPSVPGIKRKAPTSSLQCLTPQQLQPIDRGHVPKTWSENLFCKVCQVPCSGLCNFKQHVRGRQHKAKLQELKLSREEGREKANRNRQQWCKLCKISCTDANTFELHLKGQKHKAKQQELELGRKDGEGKANRRKWCELCKIWCIDEDAFNQHLEGKRHIINLHAIGGKKRAEEDEAAEATLELKDLEWQMIS